MRSFGAVAQPPGEANSAEPAGLQQLTQPTSAEASTPLLTATSRPSRLRTETLCGGPFALRQGDSGREAQHALASQLLGHSSAEA